MPCSDCKCQRQFGESDQDGKQDCPACHHPKHHHPTRAQEENSLVRPVALSSKLGKYTLLSKLGEGEWGEVHKVDGPRGVEALKLIRASGTTQVNAALQEATAMFRLPDSPHIVKITDLFTESQGVCLVMKYCSKGSLADLLLGGAVSAAEVRRVLREASSGLEVVHSRGIVHRDVKPSNLLFDEGNRVLVGDFGLARGVENLYIGGCKPFLAPEVGKGMTSASDMWALGCVGVSLITGEVFEERYRQDQWVLGGLSPEERDAYLRDVLIEVPQPLKDVLIGLLRSNPDERLTAAEVVQRLQQVYDETVADINVKKSDTPFLSTGSQSEIEPLIIHPPHAPPPRLVVDPLFTSPVAKPPAYVASDPGPSPVYLPPTPVESAPEKPNRRRRRWCLLGICLILLLAIVGLLLGLLLPRGGTAAAAANGAVSGNSSANQTRAPTPRGANVSAIYCPSAEDLIVAYGSAKINDRGWVITGSGGAATKASFDLLGGYVEFDADFSKTQLNVSGIVYTISPKFDSSAFQNTAYCDGSLAGAPWCAQVDLIQSNGNCAAQTSLHTIRSSGPGGCTTWGCYFQWKYQSGAKVHVKSQFAADGAWTTIRDGLNINPSALSPAPGASDWQILTTDFRAYGAVVYSSQWTGWFPMADACPGGSGSLTSSSFTVSNLVISGKVVQGPVPRTC